MIQADQGTAIPASSLAEELAQLYKEFAAFNDFYACFCDTLAGVATDNEVIDTRTIQGVDRCCRWMKHRMEEFRVRLEVIYEKCQTRIAK